MIDCDNSNNTRNGIMGKNKDKKAPEAEVDTKGKKGAKADKGEKAEKKEKAAEFKFGVTDLAEKLDIKEASVRVQLRNKGVAKAGKSYGWNTKAELEEVAKQLKSKDDAGAEKADKADKKDKKGDKEGKKEKKGKKDK
jgi:hypothetical protein